MIPIRLALRNFMCYREAELSFEGLHVACLCGDNGNGKFGDMFPQRWIPSNLGILAEGFTVENKLMNPTYKIVRPKVEEHYSELLDFLYTSESKSVLNNRNREAMKQLLSK